MAIIVSLMLIPLLSEIIIHNNLGLPLKPIAWLGFYWMGLVFLLACGFIILDILTHSVSLYAKARHLSAVSLSHITHKKIYIVIVSAILVSFNAMQHANNPVVETIQIKNNHNDRKIPPIRMVQISDIHIGLTSSENLVKKIISIIKSLNPDIIVSTGDLIDMQTNHISEYADLLKDMKAPLGKFAVLGNHEAYAGLDQTQMFLERSGFTLLSNQSVILDNAIQMIGVDDPAVAMITKTSQSNEADLLRQNNSNLFTVLLKHQPVLNTESTKLFDLQLSGHTHGGQVFPFSLLTRLAYNLTPGLSTIDEQTQVYVSRGTGTWGPPMRLGADPEITVFEIN